MKIWYLRKADGFAVARRVWSQGVVEAVGADMKREGRNVAFYGGRAYVAAPSAEAVTGVVLTEQHKLLTIR